MSDEFEDDEEQAPQHWFAKAVENCGCAVVLLVAVLLLFSSDLIRIIQAIRGKP